LSWWILFTVNYHTNDNETQHGVCSDILIVIDLKITYLEDVLCVVES